MPFRIFPRFKITSKFIILTIVCLVLIGIVTSFINKNSWSFILTWDLGLMILFLDYFNKRNKKYEIYCLGCNVYGTERGDIIELSILGFNLDYTATYLKFSYLNSRCFLNWERTNYIIEEIHLLASFHNVTIFDDLVFNYYDDACVTLKRLKKAIRRDINNNLCLLRTTALQPRDMSQKIKRHSRLFGIFKREL